MSTERFLDLVKDQHGFEFTIGYRDEVDHILGGKDDTVWYVIQKDSKTVEQYIGKQKSGVWEDTYIKGRGASAKTKAMPSGSTLKRIAERAYWMQQESWVAGRKPKTIEDSHPHYHYVYGFGDKALDVSVAYGVTIGYSDLKDVPGGYHLRDVITGDDVELP